MRRVRIAVCILFVVSCVVFSGYMIKTRVVEDNKPPEITYKEQEITISVEDGEKALLKGMKAKDNRDGNVTKDIRVASQSHFISKGTRTVDYIVFDQANNAGKASRTVVYSDYTSPKIHLYEPFRYTKRELESVNLLESVTAEDCLDGDLSKQVRITMSDDYYAIEPGEYEVLLQVSNSAGDVRKVPVKMQIIDQNSLDERNKYYPLLSEYIVYTKVGNPLDLNAYLIGVEKSGTDYKFAEDGAYLEVGWENIGVNAEIDYATPGVYTAEFVCSGDELATASTKLYVVVEE